MAGCNERDSAGKLNAPKKRSAPHSAEGHGAEMLQKSENDKERRKSWICAYFDAW